MMSLHLQIFDVMCTWKGWLIKAPKFHVAHIQSHPKGNVTLDDNTDTENTCKPLRMRAGGARRT